MKKTISLLALVGGLAVIGSGCSTLPAYTKVTTTYTIDGKNYTVETMYTNSGYGKGITARDAVVNLDADLYNKPKPKTAIHQDPFSEDASDIK